MNKYYINNDKHLNPSLYFVPMSEQKREMPSEYILRFVT